MDLYVCWADEQSRVTSNRPKFFTTFFLTMRTVETDDKKCGTTYHLLRVWVKLRVRVLCRVRVRIMISFSSKIDVSFLLETDFKVYAAKNSSK